MYKRAKASKETETIENRIATIGVGVSLIGNLDTSDDLLICGTLNGSISAQSKVVLSPTSEVKGNIRCQEAEIYGRVNGDLTVVGHLRLKGKAVVMGDIVADKLQVEEGVYLHGRCRTHGRPL